MSTPSPKPPPKHLLPDWIPAVGMLLLPLMVTMNVAYLMGASGVRMGGSSSSFNRQFDDTYYRLAPGVAWEVDEYTIRVRAIHAGWPPFNPVCGFWSGGEMLLWDPTFVQDGVALAEEYYQWQTPGGIELETGRFLSVEELQARGLPTPRLWVDPQTGRTNPQDPNSVVAPPAAATGAGDHKPGAAPAGGHKPGTAPGAAPASPGAPVVSPPVAGASAPGSTSPREPLTPAWIADNYSKIRYIHESCITFNAAFIALYLLLAIIAAPIALTRWLKRRKASAP